MPRSRSQSLLQQSNAIEEADVMNAPMEYDHKIRAIQHFRRLKRIIDNEDENDLSLTTSKGVAREQLARMSLVVKDYNERHARRELDDEVESMIQDVIDASFYVGQPQNAFEQDSYADPLSMGREQEVARLMQELNVGNLDDVTELWNTTQGEDNIVPDSRPCNDIGKDLNWPNIIRRSRSEADLLQFRSYSVPTIGRLQEELDLSTRKTSHIDRTWPPLTEKSKTPVGSPTASLKWEDFI